MASTTLPAPKTMRPFLVIWAGQLVSMLGSGFTNFALAVWIFEKTGEATPFALTVLFGNIPSLLLTPIAGSLADRWNRKALMLLADTGSALLTLGLFFLLTFGELQIWMIYLLAAGFSALGAFQEPAYMASITMLVPKEQLARASGLGQLSGALQSLVTPLAAGFLFVAIGFRGIVLLDFITFFFALGTLLVTPVPQPEAPPAEEAGRKANWRDDLAFGWKYLYQRSGLFGLLLYYASVNFFLSVTMVLLGPLVLSNHTATQYGLVQMMIGLGVLVGSIILSAWGGPKGRKVPLIIIFIASSAIGLMVTGAHPSYWVIGAGMFLMLLTIPLASGLSQAVFQTKVAPEVQGRVFAVRSMLSRAVTPLAYLLAGPLADKVLNPLMSSQGAFAGTWVANLLGSGPGRGIGLGFVLSGLLMALICAAVYANPRIRLLEDELPDAVVDGNPEPALT
jgi:MFS transporter, DHA3 family, macrolide efflux protein